MRPVSHLSLFDPEASARLVEASDSDEFGAALLTLAQSIAGIDEVFAYIVQDGGEPEVLISQSRLSGVEDRVAAYVGRFYRHDPAVHAIKAIPAGESFVQHIALANILQHDYRTHCFTRPGFSEKLTFGWRGNSYLLVVSFYSTTTQQLQALGKLGSLANLTLAAMVRQHSPINRNGAGAIINARLRRSFPTLSERERQVCSLTMIGWSAGSIAEALDVSRGTVLTYRQRAYQKLSVSSALELVPAILN